MQLLLQSFARSGSNYLLTLLHNYYQCEVEDLGSIAFENYKSFFHPTDNKDIILYKSHHPCKENGIMDSSIGDLANYTILPVQMDKYILLLRSPLECIPRHCELSNLKRGETKFENSVISNYIDIYLDFLEKFENITIPKTIVYYEDLIKTPEDVMKNIISFVGIDRNKQLIITDEIKDKSIRKHKFVTHVNDDEKYHQKGMPLEVFLKMKNKFRKFDMLNRYFN